MYAVCIYFCNEGHIVCPLIDTDIYLHYIFYLVSLHFCWHFVTLFLCVYYMLILKMYLLCFLCKGNVHDIKLKCYHLNDCVIIYLERTHIKL